ncbi:MAG TPA: NADH-quinone oxidoreductase subunit NuoK [Myxococcaceae bacterium]|jgi:NADH-quinone oxidoreductase subunit K|nr:NADH-quinone oxidoreductase subunit NuoK [Myxococcaceae bacterium]
MTLRALLLVATALFSLGIYGLLTRRQAVALLLSIEVMANAANLVFVAFARYGGAPGHPLVLFALAITVAEVAVGLALVLLLYRRYGDTLLELASEAKG